MSGSSKNTRQSFELNGVTINPPVEWTDIEVTASFDNDSIQANINFDSFRFVNKEAQVLKQWITDGYPGIFEGVPFKMKAFNNLNSVDSFDGFINLSDDAAFLEDGSVVANIVKKHGLDNLQDRLDALTWGYLEEIGAVTQSDYTNLDYVVEKKEDLFKILMSNIILFLMIKELAESIMRVADDIATVIAMISIYPGGSIGAVIWFAAKALINLAYTIILLAAVIDLGNKMLETLLPRLRTHKTIQLRRALTIVANHLGYNFVSPITELDNVYFLPSNPRQDNVNLIDGLITSLKGTPTGIPNVNDYGYGCGEFFSVIKDLPYGRFAIIGNDLHFRSDNDPFWIKNSTYQMPDVLIEEQKYNTDELATRFAFLFQIDQRDDWTIDNYLGTAIERVTDAIQVNIPQAKYLSGLDEVKIPYALANRKNELNGVENVLKFIANFLDSVAQALGGNSNLAGSITGKLGVMKVSDNSHIVPKLVYLAGGKIPVNQRDLFSAPVLYAKYWNQTSFIANNFRRQRKVYNNVRVPFGLNNFIELIDNSYFTPSTGGIGKVKQINWRLFSDYATISYWEQHKYAPNLKETFIIQP